MTVRCVECRLFSLQEHESMAREGFGRCKLDAGRPGRFRSAVFPITCDSHAAALQPVTDKRLEWLDLQRELRLEAVRKLQAQNENALKRAR